MAALESLSNGGTVGGGNVQVNIISQSGQQVDSQKTSIALILSR
jgi:hypothetical protein